MDGWMDVFRDGSGRRAGGISDPALPLPSVPGSVSLHGLSLSLWGSNSSLLVSPASPAAVPVTLGPCPHPGELGEAVPAPWLLAQLGLAEDLRQPRVRPVQCPGKGSRHKLCQYTATGGWPSPSLPELPSHPTISQKLRSSTDTD